MNESDLEQELRSLKPSLPSSSLASRIAGDLENSHLPPTLMQVQYAGEVVPASRRRRVWWMAGLGFASVFALVLLLSRLPDSHDERDEFSEGQPATAANPAAALLSDSPSELVNELIGAEDEGIVRTEDAEPSRQLRVVYLERQIWTNPKSGAVIEFEVPREDIVLMPVAMQ